MATDTVRSDLDATQSDADAPHIVDVLIEERATQLKRHPRIWRMVQRHLYPILGYQAAIDLVDRVQSMSGYEVFSYLSDSLSMDVEVSGIEHLPADGRVVAMPNHPAGIADGIAVFDALKHTRPDMAFFANRDAIRCHQRLDEIIIPVEWMEERRNHAKSKETVRNMLRAFRDERFIVIFASGRLAQPTLSGLVERPWLTSGVSLAQKYECPIVPMYVSAHNSALYYLLWFLNTELKDMTLFRELLNKSGQHYKIHIGAPIPHDVHSRMSAEVLTPKLRSFVVNDLRQGKVQFS